MGTGYGAGAKSYIAMRFANTRGVEIHELTMRQPAAPKTISGDNAGAGSDANLMGQFTNFFPKVGVFGVALIGVILWNIRKAWGKDHEKMDTEQEEFYRERIRQYQAERRRSKRQENEKDDEDDAAKNSRSKKPAKGKSYDSDSDY